MVPRSRYLGGFIGDHESEKAWLVEKVMGWTDSVDLLAGVAHRHQKKVYSGLKKSLQKEWGFVHCATPHIGDEFCPVEEGL